MGIWSKLYLILSFYSMLKKEIRELEAIIITIKVLDIQKGPYRSG